MTHLKEAPMPAQLPRALADYFAAKNNQDIDAMLANFAAEASVKDEGQEHRGRPAIRSWLEHTTRKYRVSVEIQNISKVGDRDVVSGLVSGNFPGSPATIRYAFTLSGAAIARLEIG